MKTLNAHNLHLIFIEEILILLFQVTLLKISRNAHNLKKNLLQFHLIMLQLTTDSESIEGIYIFLTLILYISFKNENIIPTNMCYDQVNVFTQKLQEIGVTISSKMIKIFKSS